MEFFFRSDPAVKPDDVNETRGQRSKLIESAIISFLRI